MIIRKDLVIAILATFCLTAVLFTAMPVSSSGKQYDPWLDYNDDGIIDLKDVYPMHQAYGTLGDSTRNVNVTNFPPSPPFWKTISVVQNLNVTWSNAEYGYHMSPLIDLGCFFVADFGKALVYINVANFTHFEEPNTIISGARLDFHIGSQYEYGCRWICITSIAMNFTTNLMKDLSSAYPSEGMRSNSEPHLRIRIQGVSWNWNGPTPPTISCLVSICIYLRTD